MRQPDLKRPRKTLVLFVWDGTRNSIAVAQKFCANIKDALICPVSVQPHESICVYGAAQYDSGEPNNHERRLRQKFRRHVKGFPLFQGRKLELQFGERVEVITRIASLIHAKFILLPRFEQSMFSIWVHGDLNERIQSKISVPVTFYDRDPPKNSPLTSEKPRVDTRTSENNSS